MCVCVVGGWVDLAKGTEALSLSLQRGGGARFSCRGSCGSALRVVVAGFLLSSEFFCWRNLMSTPRFVRLDDIVDVQWPTKGIEFQVGTAARWVYAGNPLLETGRGSSE